MEFRKFMEKTFLSTFEALSCMFNGFYWQRRVMHHFPVLWAWTFCWNKEGVEKRNRDPMVHFNRCQFPSLI